MKTILTILSLLCSLPLIAQKIGDGYIITADHDTLRDMEIINARFRLVLLN